MTMLARLMVLRRSDVTFTANKAEVRRVARVKSALNNKLLFYSTAIVDKRQGSLT